MGITQTNHGLSKNLWSHVNSQGTKRGVGWRGMQQPSVAKKMPAALLSDEHF